MKKEPYERKLELREILSRDVAGGIGMCRIRRIKTDSVAGHFYDSLGASLGAAYWMRDWANFSTMADFVFDCGIFGVPGSVTINAFTYLYQMGLIAARGGWDKVAVIAERALDEKFKGYSDPNLVSTWRALFAAVLRRNQEARAFAEKAMASPRGKPLERESVMWASKALIAICDESWVDFATAYSKNDATEVRSLESTLDREIRVGNGDYFVEEFWHPFGILIAAVAEARGAVVPRTELSDLNWIRNG